jgi:hypothetical protein
VVLGAAADHLLHASAHASGARRLQTLLPARRRRRPGTRADRADPPAARRSRSPLDNLGRSDAAFFAGRPR